MIRNLLVLLLLFASAACSEREAAAPSPAAKPALWVVERESGVTAGWLFGTIHALPDGTDWETPELNRAIADSGVLVVEVRDLDPERIGVTIKRLAHDDPGPPLAERLPPAARADLAKLLAAKDVEASRFDGLETWAAALALSRLAGTAPTANGVDKALLSRFAGRPIAELEGAAGQLAIFDALAEPDQRRLLAAVLAEQGDPATDAQQLAKAWLAGDLAQLEATTRRGLLADPALYKALADDRNRAWLVKLLPLFEGGRRPLVAVGTAHMFGLDGLPALIAATGYTVRRIQ